MPQNKVVVTVVAFRVQEGMGLLCWQLQIEWTLWILHCAGQAALIVSWKSAFLPHQAALKFSGTQFICTR